MANMKHVAIQFPLGIDSFWKLRKENCYYVDKTNLIQEMLSQKFEVNLLTRPRRFGKTLTISMLEDFFDIARDSREDFKGLAICGNEGLCGEWMNQWPTVFLTLKSVSGLTFEEAFDRFKILISDLCVKYSFLLDSPNVNAVDRLSFRKLSEKAANKAET